MERPQIIYLDEPIQLYGIEVKHSEAGLRYLVAHYEHCIAIATPQQMDQKARDHANRLIDQYRQYIELYEKQRAEKETESGATKV